jgi:UDP-hydrolysing UDP-N-acetyl-D-glucosamine 2-epimerase
MKAQRRICVVITARPSYSRIKTAIKAMHAHPGIDLHVVVAASALLDRYGMAVRHIEDDAIPISARVSMVLEGEDLKSMAKTTGLGVLELSSVFDNLRPDLVVTVADRYETLATAVSATYMNMPLVHVQGGEISGSIDERVRHAVTKLADLHLVSTTQAAQRIARMGEDPNSIIVTGCPSIDLAAEILKEQVVEFDPFALYGGVGDTFDYRTGPYVVALQHPVTTEYELSRSHVLETLRAVRDLDVPTFWFWPNVDAGADGTSGGIRAFRELEDATGIRFFKDMAPEHFLRLMSNAKCVIGNSSVGIRECSFLGVPVVNIGSRQQGRERGNNVLDVDYERKAIAEAIREQMIRGRYPQSHLYGDGRSGERIAEVLSEVSVGIEKQLTY